MRLAKGAQTESTAWLPTRVGQNDLFDNLDGSVVTARHGEWRVTVFSIYEEGAERWVQLALQGHRPYTLTLHMDANENANAAVMALSSWLANPDDTSHIRNVA
jgi:hypothetical protein